MFAWPGSATPRPGQFLTVRVSDGPWPLLRRPFAFSHIDLSEGSAGIIYKVRGNASRALSQKRPGEDIDIIGSLGNSFPDPPPDRKSVLLAGGIGLGPMLFFASALREAGRDFLFFYGCQSESEIPVLDDFTILGAELCTDDGSRGFCGTTVDRAAPLQGAMALYGCGPTGMLKACHELAVERHWPCWVSLEQTMGCAMGACMGCVVKTVKAPGYVRVCQDGPIFDSRVIEWS